MGNKLFVLSSVNGTAKRGRLTIRRVQRNKLVSNENLSSIKKMNPANYFSLNWKHLLKNLRSRVHKLKRMHKVFKYMPTPMRNMDDYCILITSKFSASPFYVRYIIATAFVKARFNLLERFCSELI